MRGMSLRHDTILYLKTNWNCNNKSHNFLKMVYCDVSLTITGIKIKKVPSSGYNSLKKETIFAYLYLIFFANMTFTLPDHRNET